VLAVAALVTWLLAGSAGLYMFRTWLSRGGRAHQSARKDGLPPAVIVTHLGFGALGFAVWAGYLVTGWDALAWSAVGLLMPGIGLGICTVTLWAPYPTPPGTGPPTAHDDAGPGGAGPVSGMLAAPAEDALAGQVTDEALTRALSSEAQASKLINDMLAVVPARQEPPPRRSRRHLAPLIPAGHGMAAVATFVLAVLSAINGR
jgi:hypothetical protein